MLAQFIIVPVLQMLEMRLRCLELQGFGQLGVLPLESVMPDQQGILRPSGALLGQNLGLGGRITVLVMLVHTRGTENHCPGQWKPRETPGFSKKSASVWVLCWALI